uniref:Uncharacterized protein n=1 Tax=Meloidogyne enterolobii TaxID=390850 RepID=A0A6V7VMI6_MELEN|nr:unnamed protein product [Meloidogyne enterolobii]
MAKLNNMKLLIHITQQLIEELEAVLEEIYVDINNSNDSKLNDAKDDIEKENG